MSNRPMLRVLAAACLTLAAGTVFAAKGGDSAAPLQQSPASSGHSPSGTPTQVFTLDIGGANSNGACDFNAITPGNETLTFNLGPNAVITGLGGAGTISTIGASWLSEAGIHFIGADPLDTIRLRFLSTSNNTNAAGAPYNIDPPLDLTDAGVTNIPLGASGQLTLEFCETFVDNAGSGDAVYAPGSTVTVACYDCVDPNGTPPPPPAPYNYVPVPVNSGWAIALLGSLLALGAAFTLRRRSNR